MKLKTVCFALLMSFCLLAAPLAQASGDVAVRNAELVRQAFEDWKAGRGSVFDLLSDDAEWTVAGNSPVSDVYRGRQDLVERAVKPIAAHLSTPITPRVRQIVAEGDTVAVFWDGRAKAKDGRRYENSYAWLFTMGEGRIVRATAYLDTWLLVELMK
jgi:ketosteroid isomerase-like protein